MAETAVAWTLAWRNSKYGNRLVRATNWSGTWTQAMYLGAVQLEALRSHGHPRAQVFYVVTRASEDRERREIAAGRLPAHRAEDLGNVLMDSGRRVAMHDSGSLSRAVLDAVLPADVADARFEGLHGPTALRMVGVQPASDAQVPAVDPRTGLTPEQTERHGKWCAGPLDCPVCHPADPCDCLTTLDEVRVSSCPRGCKVYRCTVHGAERVIHNAAYGCHLGTRANENRPYYPAGTETYDAHRACALTLGGSHAGNRYCPRHGVRVARPGDTL